MGDIVIQIDNKTISYNAISAIYDKTCKDLDGRYYICVPFVPDGRKHEIACFIKNYLPSENDDIESGERLELKSFYAKSCKLSIGMEGESGYFSDGYRLSTTYDYDNEYTENGVKYIIFAETATDRYSFGIAWINRVNEENDVQTWFGADPTLMLENQSLSIHNTKIIE
ncbi:MAG: hypothetical protein RR071_03335 [Lachnospiraceae bacterium]